MGDGRGRVVVVGSLNLDRRFEVPRLPSPGETVSARRSTTGPGGKGLNQAVAAARSGARVEMIGCVGADEAGRELVAVARRDGIGVVGVTVLDGVDTGQAVVWVDDAGDNCIVVVGGANDGLADRSAPVAALVDRLDLGPPDVVLAQGETSLAVTAAVFGAVRAHGVTTVLNLAPYQAPPAELLAATTVLVVNETEFASLVGSPASTEVGDLAKAARGVVDRGPEVVVITLGARGAVAVTADAVHDVAGRPVDVVDTTGAGDGFVGVLAGALAGTMGLEAALADATAAASLVVQRPGAASAMPARAEIDGVADRPISGG